MATQSITRSQFSANPPGPGGCAALLQQVKRLLAANHFRPLTPDETEGLLADINWHLTQHPQVSGTATGSGGSLSSSSAAQPDNPRPRTRRVRRVRQAV